MYLLVLDARVSEAKNNLLYWLQAIRDFAGEAPVLVVVNKSEGRSPLALDEPRLRTDYPNIRGFHYVSCQAGTGVPELRAAAAELVRDLPHVFTPVPKLFFSIKQSIENKALSAPFISLSEYRAVCVRHGLIAPAAQAQLRRLLQDLDVLLNFGTPNAPAALDETSVLRPDWVSLAGRKILTSPVLGAQNGVLDRADLPEIFVDRSWFPESIDEFVLALMCKFELCFEFAGSSGQRFLVPEQLPADEPNVGWLDEHDPNALSFQVRYDALPPKLIYRLIARMHEHLTPPPGPGRLTAPTLWRTGCVLHVGGNRCLVRGRADKRRVYIQVQGPDETRREALGLIRDRLGEIHRATQVPRADEFVPVPGQPGVVLAHAALVRNARAGIGRFVPEKSEAPVEVHELLARVDTAPQVPPRPSPRAVPNPVDVGIIATSEEAYREVVRRFEPVQFVGREGRHYLSGVVLTPRGERTVLIARSPEQGQGAVQSVYEMLADADPRWLLPVGTTGAFPAKTFTLGDVILASRVQDVSVTAALESGAPTGEGAPVRPSVTKLLSELWAGSGAARLGDWNGPSMVPMENPFQSLAKGLATSATYGRPEWRNKVRTGLRANFPLGEPPRRPKYRVEGVIPGKAQAQDPKLVRRWKESAHQVERVELELAEVYAAAHAHDKPVLAVLGVSDIVGLTRSSVWTEYACQTAAAFARALIGTGLIELP